MDFAEVLVSVRKYDGSRHWRYSAVRLGEDDHGTWLGVRVGTAYGKGAEDAVYRTREPRVVLIPRDAWWTALFQEDPAQLDVYCDVTTPSRWPHPHEVTTVDLDLDVCRTRAEGEVLVVDEDEFAVHQVRYGYPAEVVERATASAEWLRAALGAGVEPFAGDFRPWLARMG